jgi:hypothetical protein
MRRLPALALLCCLPLAVAMMAGCGEGGVSAGATVSVYVAAPLCKGAEAELAKAGGKAGDLKVRAVCLPAIESKRGLSLATSGANARRATEDSTTVAFLEASGPAARFSQTIVESAGVAWLQTADGTTAMRRVLRALDNGSSSPRSEVRESL